MVHRPGLRLLAPLNAVRRSERLDGGVTCLSQYLRACSSHVALGSQKPAGRSKAAPVPGPIQRRFRKDICNYAKKAVTMR